MFRITPPTFFRQLPALLKFKIHQPLPLTQRESNQLLELLTTSFRQQLDSEHGPSDTATSMDSTKVDTSTSHKQPESSRPRRLSGSGCKHTDRHMKSILTDPLFNQRPQRGEPGSIQDPMDTFDRAVGRGLMTLKYAKAILIAKKKQLKSSHETLEEGIRKSGAGIKILKWLKSSGLNQNTDFLLQDQRFGVLLFEFMRAEGYEDIFWEWINKAIHDTSATKAELQGLAQLVSKVVEQTTKLDASLNTSISILFRVSDMAKDLRFETVRSLLINPGQHIFQLIVKGTRQVREATSLESFRIFQQILPIFSIHDVDLHILDIYSPYQRSADRFLEFFRKRPSLMESETEDLRTPFEHNEAKKMVSISLMAAHVLLEQNRVNDATWIMERLRTDYPKLLGVEADIQERKGEFDEASSIQILESLSIA
ncbi:hypothetical protein SBOR_4856 [Sclerotinia borealis F-4128]|uniref:Uncharacterized protein n=1 Tax=Sclerotinia borealis (strain F-4128) TaxID=1432307 RepID=W9CJ84_SCLBF|nr:hypothetical protein SBOR_4856 [Sclerotinia borealis F-4128]